MRIEEVLYNCTLVEMLVSENVEDDFEESVISFESLIRTLKKNKVFNEYKAEEVNIKFQSYMDKFEDIDETDDDERYDMLSKMQQIIDELEDTIESKDLKEGPKRAFKRVGKEIKRWFRCVGGPKDGKLVATPGSCAKRKDPKKVRRGRKTMRIKRNIILRKGKITRNKAVSKMVVKMNRRLSGK